MRPQRRVSSTEYDAAADFDAIGEVDLVTGGNDTAVTQNEHRIDWVHDFRIGNGVDLVHPDDLAVSSQAYFGSAANDVQMSDTHVVFNVELFDACDDIEMTDTYVVGDRAVAGVDDAKPDPDSLPDPVSKEPTVDRPFQE